MPALTERRAPRGCSVQAPGVGPRQGRQRRGSGGEGEGACGSRQAGAARGGPGVVSVLPEVPRAAGGPGGGVGVTGGPSGRGGSRSLTARARAPAPAPPSRERGVHGLTPPARRTAAGRAVR